MEVTSRFNDWIANRIKDFDFVENQDFIIFTKNLVKGRPSTEYSLTIGMAKELCMVERNEKGRQARRYFIDCERRLREGTGNAGNRDSKRLDSEQIVGNVRHFAESARFLKIPVAQRPVFINSMVRNCLGIDLLAIAGVKPEDTMSSVRGKSAAAVKETPPVTAAAAAEYVYRPALFETPAAFASDRMKTATEIWKDITKMVAGGYQPHPLPELRKRQYLHKPRQVQTVSLTSCFDRQISGIARSPRIRSFFSAMPAVPFSVYHYQYI